MIELAGSRYVAVLDASVLFSIRATNLILEIATHHLFQPRWTDDIHAEWTRNLVAKSPSVDPARIAKRRRDMELYFPNARITGHDLLTVTPSLPDPDDNHVLAAAITARADAIVTYNLRHFPADQLAPYGIEPIHPDAFLLAQLGLDPVAVVTAARTVRARLHAPPQSPDDFLSALVRAKLPRMAFELAQHKDKL